IGGPIDPVVRVQPRQLLEEVALVYLAREVDARAQREPDLLGVLVRGRCGEADALAVAVRAQPDAGVDEEVERRVIDDADQRRASMVEREHGAESRDAVDEFFGAIDRIDDPLKRAVGPRGRILVADDAVVGEPALDELAHSTLDRLIHLGDERPVGLRLHAEATFEGPRGDPARFVSQLDRRRVIALDVAGRDHHAASYTSTLHPVPARRASARAQGKIRRMPYIMGIDTGGTFTDGVVMDADGRLVTAKAPSTPDDFSEGVMESLRLAGERLSLTTEALLRDTARLALGTTVGTNAMLQRRGARVGLITTQGHRGGIHSLRGAPGVPGPHQAQGLHLPESGKPDPIVPKPFI